MKLPDRARQLLRFPGICCPGEALTGNDVLDAYVRELDARLLGSARVRMLTLAEISDHLREKTGTLLAEGQNEEQAARTAVTGMGSSENFASEQRRELGRKFKTLALVTGIPYGLFMALFLTVCEKLPLHDAIWAGLALLIFGGGFFGGTMAWFVTYAWPPRRPNFQSVAPTGKGIGEPGQQEPFSVAYPKSMRVLSVVVTVCAILGATYFLAGGLASCWHPSIADWMRMPWWLAACLGLLLFMECPMFLSSRRVFQVDADGFLFVGRLGRKRRVAWDQIAATGSLGERHPWIPRWSAWRNVKYVECVCKNGRQRRFPIYADMVNADRLATLIQTKLAERQAKAA